MVIIHRLVGSQRTPNSLHKHHRRAARAIIPIALATVALSACQASPPAAVENVQAALNYGDETIEFPLDQYVMSDKQVAFVDQANSILMQRCMLGKNLAFPQAEFDVSAAPTPPDRTYGVWNLESAAKYGYDLPPNTLREAASAANENQSASWRAAAQECFDGLDLLPTYVLNLIGDDTTSAVLRPVQRIADSAYQSATSDERWADARSDWWTCLEAAGIKPRKDDSAWSPEVPEDQEGAIRTAITDVKCKERTNLVARLANLEASYQASLIQGKESQLNEVARKSKQVADTAEQIVAGHG